MTIRRTERFRLGARRRETYRPPSEQAGGGGVAWQKTTEQSREAAAIRSSARWQAVRALHLGEHPLCCVCGRLAAEVHHWQPVARQPELAFSESNLAAVCVDCHPRLDRAMARGAEPEGAIAYVRFVLEKGRKESRAE